MHSVRMLPTGTETNVMVCYSCYCELMRVRLAENARGASPLHSFPAWTTLEVCTTNDCPQCLNSLPHKRNGVVEYDTDRIECEYRGHTPTNNGQRADAAQKTVMQYALTTEVIDSTSGIITSLIVDLMHLMRRENIKQAEVLRHAMGLYETEADTVLVGIDING